MENSILNKINSLNIYFINFGNVHTDIHYRMEISEKHARSKFDSYVKSLQPGEYVSLNETYLDENKMRQQGKCIDYCTK